MDLAFQTGAVAAAALDVLAKRLELGEVPSPTTHTVLAADDLEHPEVPGALGGHVFPGSEDEGRDCWRPTWSERAARRGLRSWRETRRASELANPA